MYILLVKSPGRYTRYRITGSPSEDKEKLLAKVKQNRLPYYQRAGTQHFIAKIIGEIKEKDQPIIVQELLSEPEETTTT